MNLPSIYDDDKLKNLEDTIDDLIKNNPSKQYTFVKNASSDGISSEIINSFISPSYETEDPEVNKIKSMLLGKNSKDSNSDPSMNEVSSLLDKITVPPERTNRYKVYEEIYRSVPLIQRVMKVYTSNICQKNPVTSKSILVRDSNETPSEIKVREDFEQLKAIARKFTEISIDKFDILNRLKYKILPFQELYGDCFVELIDLDTWKDDQDKNPLSMTGVDGFLGESVLSYSHKSNKQNTDINPSKSLDGLISKLNSIETGSSISSSSFDDKIDPIISELSDYFVIDSSEDILTESFLYDEDSDMIDLQEAVDIDIRAKTKKSYLEEMKTFYQYYIKPDGDVGKYLITKLNDKIIKESENKRGRKKKILNEDRGVVSNLGGQYSPTEWPNEIKKDFSFSRLLMLTHHPSNIVILETEYGTRLGYLEVKSTEEPATVNIGQQLSTIIGKITSIGNRSAVPQEIIFNKLVKSIVKKLISGFQNKNNKSGNSGQKQLDEKQIDKLLKSISPEVFYLIKRLLIETNKSDLKAAQFKRVKARFIPENDMLHFSMPSSEHLPYGSSIVEPLVLHSKLYILSQLANIITKLSRAALVRKWIIDVGPMQMQSGMMQKLKRELYNTRVTVDDMCNFKSMPKLLSDFKDLFVISKGGTRAVDVEMQSFGDPSIRVADLEDARKELIALSGIPAPSSGGVKKKFFIEKFLNLVNILF